MRHGSRSTFDRYKCRCDACVEVARTYYRTYARTRHRARAARTRRAGAGSTGRTRARAHERRTPQTPDRATFTSVLPAPPLLDVITRWCVIQVVRHGDARPLQELARRTGVTERTLQRIVAGQPSVSISSADRISRALGRHPSNVWPREWEAV